MQATIHATRLFAEVVVSARTLLLGTGLAASLTVPLMPASGQESKTYAETPKDIVHLLTGTGHSTSAYLADDMRMVLSSNADFQLLPSITDGDLANIEDILALDFVDLIFSHINVLEYFFETGLEPKIKQKLSYLTKMHNEEFHLLARADISNFSMLNGKKVNIGQNVDVTYITATEIFHQNGVDVIATTSPHLMAYSLLKAGEIDAMAIVDGSPSDLLRLASLDDGVRLLDVPAEGLSKTYVPSRLDNKDYPKLLAPGDSIATVAVPTVLMAYAWPDGSEKRGALDRFIDAFLEALPTLRSRERAFHVKWQEVDLWAPLLGGWQRDPYLIERLNPMKRFKGSGNG
ncbi:MAG: TAXI family TRAP transporter solute-binding subunit [Alphaproteobacteria bacterium]